MTAMAHVSSTAPDVRTCHGRIFCVGNSLASWRDFSDVECVEMPLWSSGRIGFSEDNDEAADGIAANRSAILSASSASRFNVGSSPEASCSALEPHACLGEMLTDENRPRALLPALPNVARLAKRISLCSPAAATDGHGV